VRARDRRAETAPAERDAEVVRLRTELVRLRTALGLRESVEALPETFEVLLGAVGGEALAVPLAQVLEVVPRVLIAALPEAPAPIAGYMAWRGQQVPVLDMGVLCAGRPLPVRLEDRIVVVREGTLEPRGLLVSEVDGVARLEKSALASPRPDAAGAAWALGFFRESECSYLLVALDALRRHLVSDPLPGVACGDQ
jgi:chemotaxis signal transduction protein